MVLKNEILELPEPYRSILLEDIRETIKERLRFFKELVKKNES